uniref:Uncharacterized protein n=1 Tax=Emiliania huxleyi (strain CCMP1516) TaxID=280463 RepID=A0A0D3KGZ1_EMIH1
MSGSWPRWRPTRRSKASVVLRTGQKRRRRRWRQRARAWAATDSRRWRAGSRAGWTACVRRATRWRASTSPSSRPARSSPLAPPSHRQLRSRCAPLSRRARPRCRRLASRRRARSSPTRRHPTTAPSRAARSSGRRASSRGSVCIRPAARPSRRGSCRRRRQRQAKLSAAQTTAAAASFFTPSSVRHNASGDGRQQLGQGARPARQLARHGLELWLRPHCPRPERVPRRQQAARTRTVEVGVAAAPA